MIKDKNVFIDSLIALEDKFLAYQVIMSLMAFVVTTEINDNLFKTIINC